MESGLRENWDSKAPRRDFCIRPVPKKIRRADTLGKRGKNGGGGGGFFGQRVIHLGTKVAGVRVTAREGAQRSGGRTMKSAP